MSYTVYPRRSYAAQHLFTALRTLPWYVLPPSLLMLLIAGFLFSALRLLGDTESLRVMILGLTVIGAGTGFFLWSVRQFIRIIQLARYYCL